MKYAITGHTSGIGNALYNCLPDSKGFSKSLGYDITSNSGRKKIVEESQDCDVFINNAFDGFGQTLMLLDIFNSWKNTSKTIINVGSAVAEDNNILKNYEYLLEYQIQKKSLKILNYDLIDLGYNVHIKYVWFGYVGTERILKKYPDMAPNNYITVQEAINKILL